MCPWYVSAWNKVSAESGTLPVITDKSEKARTCKQTRQASARRPENRAVSLARLTLSFPFRIRPLHILLSFALHLHVFASPLLSHCIAFRLPHGTRHPHWWFILYALLTLLLQAYCRLVRLTRHFLWILRVSPDFPSLQYVALYLPTIHSMYPLIYILESTFSLASIIW